jgi:hypothetical protein
VLTRQSLRFDPAEYRAETFIPFDNLDVVNGVAPGEVE